MYDTLVYKFKLTYETIMINPLETGQQVGETLRQKIRYFVTIIIMNRILMTIILIISSIGYIL